MIDHDTIDELLAGYVMRSLSGEDAAEMERLLNDHVPDCTTCRETLDAFRAVAADVGTSVPEVSPPNTLLPMVQRSLDARRRRAMASWSPGRIVAAAAAAVLLVGIAGLAVTESGSGPDELLTQADLSQVQQIADAPGSEETPLGGETQEVTAPGGEDVYVMGQGVTPPPSGATYRIWALSGEEAEWVGDFVPVNGEVAFRIEIDPLRVDGLLITVEPAGSEPSEPGVPAWPAAS